MTVPRAIGPVKCDASGPGGEWDESRWRTSVILAIDTADIPASVTDKALRWRSCTIDYLKAGETKSWFDVVNGPKGKWDAEPKAGLSCDQQVE